MTRMARWICSSLVLGVLVLALQASPARAQFDWQRMGAPDLKELETLRLAEEWELVMVKGEALVARLEAAHDRSGLYFAYTALWFAYSNLGFETRATEAIVKAKTLFYELNRNDPTMARHAANQYASALALSGKRDEAMRVADEILARLPPDDENRDSLLWTRAMASFVVQRTTEAASTLADDAVQQRRLADTDAPNRRIHLFHAASEYVMAAEVLDYRGQDEGKVRTYGKAALEALRCLGPLGVVKTAQRSEVTLAARASAAAGEFVQAVDLYGAYVRENLTRQSSAHLLKERNRYAAHAVLGYWEDRAGHPTQAIAHYRQCVDAIDRTWARLKLQSSKENFLGGDYHPLYVPPPARVFERLIRLLTTSGDVTGALECSEHFKARGLVDLLGRRATRYSTTAGEDLVVKERTLYRMLEKSQSPGAPPSTAGDAESVVRQYSGVVEQIRARDAEYAEVLVPAPPRASQYAALLDSETVVVEFFVGTRDSTVFVVSGQGVKAVSLAVGTEALADLVNEVRRGLRTPGPGERTRQALLPLSRAVVTPFLPLVGTAKRLVIVPHGPLHYVPFAALLDDQNRFLVESFEIDTCPSLAVLGFCERKNARRGKAFEVARVPAVAFALGDTRPARGDWAPLPGTLAEVREIQKLLPTTQIFEGQAMKTATVQQQVGSARIIHFATHGSFDSASPMDSCLVLVDHEMAVDDIFRLRMSAYSVILSACQTGLGRVTVGDDVVGLTRAFLYAGTPAVISTLWKISDESTARLMTSFYRHLAQSPRGAALRQAQLEILAAPETSHPFFWAAFVVTGDWK